MKSAGLLLRRALLALVACIALEGTAMAGADDRILSPDDAVIVSSESLASSAADDLLESNATVVNALRGEHLRDDEISRTAMKSYYVDYYLAQVNNGGFAQFVFNTRWSAPVVDLVREGLKDIGATRHLALFDEGAASVSRLGDEKLKLYLEGEELRSDPDGDALHTINDRFFALAKVENLIALNAAWLRRQPSLRPLPAERLQQEIERRAAAVPDRAARVEAARQALPRYFRLIKALCEKSGQTLERATAGDPTLVYDGKAVRQLSEEELENASHGESEIVWFFITNKGLHLMAEHGGKAAMFDNETRTKIAEVDAP